MKSPILRVYLGKDTGKDISSWVEDLDYEDTIEKDAKLTLKIFQDRVDDVLDDPVIKAKGDVYFQFGFMEGPMSEIHIAKIQNVDTTYSNAISVELVAFSKGNVMKKSTATTVWAGMTTKQIAAKIAMTYGLDLSMPFDGKKWDSLPQGNKSDMGLLKYIVNREKGGKYIVFVRNNTLYVAERGLGKTSALTLTYKGVADDEWLSCEMKWKESSPDSAAVGSADIAGNDVAGATATPDSQTDTSTAQGRITIDVADGSIFGRTSGDSSTPFGAVDNFGEIISAPAASTFKQVGKKVVTAVADTGEGSDMAHGLQNKAVLRVLTMTLTIEGQPLLKPDNIVTIAGVNRAHEGNWYVHSIHHKVGNGRYDSTIEGQRNASKVGGVGADKVNKTVGPNEKKDIVKIIIDAIDGDVLGKSSDDHSSPL